ncbi:hypothetical protein [Brasilonema sp. UFV-L1]|nr:hypothetical protein [Brasilonema sp. UFV-L1]
MIILYLDELLAKFTQALIHFGFSTIYHLILHMALVGCSEVE